MCCKEKGRISCDLIRSRGKEPDMRYYTDIIRHVNHSTLLLQKMRYIQENSVLYFGKVINTFCGRIRFSTQKYVKISLFSKIQKVS